MNLDDVINEANAFKDSELIDEMIDLTPNLNDTLDSMPTLSADKAGIILLSYWVARLANNKPIEDIE